MNARKDLAAWLDGPPADDTYVRGSGIGLPADGPGSVAPVARRFGSLVLDWAVCALVSWAFLNYDEIAILVLFALVNIVMLTMFGCTGGQLLCRVRVVPVRGHMPMLVRAVIRTAMLVLVIPAVVWNRDLQPMHDVVAGTAVVRA